MKNFLVVTCSLALMYSVNSFADGLTPVDTAAAASGAIDTKEERKENREALKDEKKKHHEEMKAKREEMKAARQALRDQKVEKVEPKVEEKK